VRVEDTSTDKQYIQNATRMTATASRTRSEIPRIRPRKPTSASVTAAIPSPQRKGLEAAAGDFFGQSRVEFGAWPRGFAHATASKDSVQ